MIHGTMMDAEGHEFVETPLRLDQGKRLWLWAAA
jgi:hypothetical protein